MKRRIVICGIGAVFLVSLVLSLWILRPSAGHRVEIVQEDAVIETIDLDTAEDREIIVYHEGSSNTIRIEDGEIWVSQAQCPDHTCVKMGKLRSKSLPIVCLPNRLIIRFAD